MESKIVLMLLLLVSDTITKGEELYRHPDVGLTIKELLPKYGYPFEAHTVTTKDNYVLELHRIPHGRINNSSSKTKPVVLILHGLLGSSDQLISLGPKRGLGCILADNGYDVWLGNHRGTVWSRKHLTLDPQRDGEAYWNFSFHELGVNDNAAFIDYILRITKQNKLFCIGHSEGTTSFFTMASVLPQYNNKIRLMVGLGPIAFIGNLKSPLVRSFLLVRNIVWRFMQRHQIYGVLKHKGYNEAIQILCHYTSPTLGLCLNLFSLVMGYNLPQTDKKTIPLLATNFPAGASWKQFYHYFQGMITGGFRQYDYGKEKNLEKYNRPDPPDYDLHKVTGPVALYYGNHDYIATETDALLTAQALPNVVYSKRVQNFNHFDFIGALDVVTLLYSDILSLMKKY